MRNDGARSSNFATFEGTARAVETEPRQHPRVTLCRLGDQLHSAEYPRTGLAQAQYIWVFSGAQASTVFSSSKFATFDGTARAVETGPRQHPRVTRCRRGDRLHSAKYPGKGCAQGHCNWFFPVCERPLFFLSSKIRHVRRHRTSSRASATAASTRDAVSTWGSSSLGEISTGRAG